MIWRNCVYRRTLIYFEFQNTFRSHSATTIYAQIQPFAPLYILAVYVVNLSHLIILWPRTSHNLHCSSCVKVAKFCKATSSFSWYLKFGAAACSFPWDLFDVVY